MVTRPPAKSSSADSSTIEGLVRRLNQANQLVKKPEFLELLKEIESKSPADRETFAEKSLEPEELSKKGIKLPQGTKIRFRAPAGASPQKKFVAINISIPELGSVIIRSRIAERKQK